MIDLYTAGTPNGRKASVMLEELELPYTLRAIDFKKEEQKRPEFLAINPNGRIPAIVDHGGAGGPITVLESGAILIYLAEKTGKLLAPSGQARYEAIEWVMFQMSAVGPMFGQWYHFASVAQEKLPYAVDRYHKESLRILGVLDGRLDGRPYLAGDYSIADVCTYPWIAAMAERLGGTSGFTHLHAWMDRVGARPGVQRGMKVPG